jgi:hypothetical protein
MAGCLVAPRRLIVPNVREPIHGAGPVRLPEGLVRNVWCEHFGN